MTGHRRIVTALSAALLLAAPAAALAQGKPRATPATSLAAKPSAPKARAGALPAEPAPEPALAPAPPIVERGPWRLAVALGREKVSDGDLAGLRVGVELERDLVALGRRGQLSFVIPAGWFHGTDSVSAATFTVDTTMDLFELVPSFRASFALVPRLRLFAEVGVGGAWGTTKTETDFSAAGVATESSTTDAFSGVFSFLAGATFQLNDRVRLGVELPAIHRRYGDGVAQTLSFSARAAYAF